MEEKKEKTEKKTIGVKTAVIIALVVIIGSLLYVYKGVFIAATINGSPVSRLAVIRELEQRAGKAALESIITQKIVGEEAVKKGIAITDDEVNAEIKNIEEQLKAQGTTLDEALTTQGLTLVGLKKQIVYQMELEKLLADKTQITDEEVGQYIKDNNITVPAGQEDVYKNQIKAQLSQQKLNVEAEAFIKSLMSQTSIKYFINY